MNDDPNRKSRRAAEIPVDQVETVIGALTAAHAEAAALGHGD